eukprot:gene9851-20490_t
MQVRRLRNKHQDEMKSLLKRAEGEVKSKTNEERLSYYKELQFREGESLFAVQHTTIHKAAFDGSIPGLLYFLKKHTAKETNVPDKAGYCPIHYCAVKGHVEALTLLVEKGVDVNTIGGTGTGTGGGTGVVGAEGGGGLTPLMFACKTGHCDVIRTILELGGHVLDTDGSGHTAAHFAAAGDHADALETLYVYVCARREGHLRQLEDAAEKERDPANIDLGCVSIPVIRASSSASATSTGVVTLQNQTLPPLVHWKTKTMGQTQTTTTSTTISPSVLTSTTSVPLVALTASDSGTCMGGGGGGVVKVSSKAAARRRSLRLSASMNASAVKPEEPPALRPPPASESQLLVRPLCVLETVSRNGSSPLHVAATVDAHRAVSYLIKAGVELDVVDSVGETALHRAAKRNFHCSYSLLLEGGARGDVKNIFWQTPSQLMTDDTQY